MSDDQQVAAAALTAFLADTELRTESLWALKQAALALSMDGVGGLLVVKIPRRTGAHAEVQFTTGSAQLTLEF